MFKGAETLLTGVLVSVTVAKRCSFEKIHWKDLTTNVNRIETSVLIDAVCEK